MTSMEQLAYVMGQEIGELKEEVATLKSKLALLRGEVKALRDERQGTRKGLETADNVKRLLRR